MIDLDRIHTKVLLGWLAAARRCGGSVDPYHDGSGSSTIVAARRVSVDELKTELATREHIPNREEARTIRQARAKEQRSR